MFQDIETFIDVEFELQQRGYYAYQKYKVARHTVGLCEDKYLEL